jgi:hypothetical protein
MVPPNMRAAAAPRKPCAARGGRYQQGMSDEIRIEGAIPAATLVIMRPGAGDADLLMVKRATTMAFAAGAVVFPGGRIDADDHVVAAIEGVRAALLAEQPLSAILAARGDRLELDALVPFARWCPNFKESRTFDTWFFAVSAPEHGHELSVSAAEHSHIFWDSAHGALAAADRGEISIIFPTRRNLERLAGHASLNSFARHAQQFPVRRITPWVEDRGGQTMLCIPDDLGYPVTGESWEMVRRG